MTDRNNIRKGEKAMKITKFFTALLLAGAMALTFTACGNDGTNDDENTPPTGSSDSTTDSASAETNPQTEASSDSGSGDNSNNSDSGDNGGNGENSGNESGEETKE